MGGLKENRGVPVVAQLVKNLMQLIQPLAWELPYAIDMAVYKKKNFFKPQKLMEKKL